MRSLRLRCGRWRLALPAWRDERAAQIVEFAVALPLLVLFVVGIFDFSGAFTLRQKLTNVARDAARADAADPASDIAQPSAPVPASVSDAFQLIDNYLLANKINDCGITAGSVVVTLPATWTYSSNSNGCPGTGLIITINRAYYFAQNGVVQAPTVSCSPQPTGSQATVIASCVSVQYAYQWKFGKVESLLGSTTGLPNSITAISVAMNEN
ncbi:MAG: TadE/TadG family type IV pilus assembly protein [Candidatus Sulfotelmatobacter sp.]